MGQEIQPNEGNGDNGYNIWKSIGFFAGEQHLSFIFKKTEKIASALYLVSSLIKDTDPIKWELREKAINLLLSAVAANSSEPVDKNAVIQSFFSDSLEALSLLNVGFLAGLISEMNYTILKNEMEAVVSLLRTKVFDDAAKAGYILSDSFFKTDPSVLKTNLKIPENVPDSTFFLKYPKDLENKAKSIKDNLKIKNKTEKIAIKDKKDSRKTAILELLKKKSHLTIKDFVDAIHGCSAKTIQRELLDLVAQGVIKKEGERRWSRYSLA